jgi:uncharacterized repeat protein (TIGR03803 family)
VFELIPPAAGETGWTAQVLYSFTGTDGDGAEPEAGLIFDKAGNLYGTTTVGGTHHEGAVFEVTP